MEDFIKLIESEFPDFHWLMRSVGGEGETLTGKYFAHIFHPEQRDQIGDLEISFRATGMTAKDAIRKAYKKAHKRMMSTAN